MTGAAPIAAVAVVVPAHDEEELIPGCLIAVQQAAEAIGEIPVLVIVVADACSDGTAESARLAGTEVVAVTARCVGHARAAGMLAALEQLRASPDRIWLATTDADTRVPARWLRRQLEYAAAGADAVAGTVTVTDWAEHPTHVPGAFAAQYAHSGDAHPHVHGANLGVRASAYLAAGGFRPLPTAEDHDLLSALVRSGHQIVRAPDIPVVTSARRHGRTPDGFSHLLARLARAAGPAA